MRKGKGMEKEREEKGKWGRGKKRGKEKEKGRERKCGRKDSLRIVGRTHARMNRRTDGHKGDFIFCPMLCIALHWTDNNYIFLNL